MAIIYQKNPSELIPQGNRAVSTFPSGLVRVDQSFIGRTSLESTHRNQLQIGDPFPAGSDPSVDGLSIFPAIQEKRLPDGFTEYMVSAYGRTNTSGNSYVVPGVEFWSQFSYFNRTTQQTEVTWGLFRIYDLISSRVIKEDVFDEQVFREIPTPELLQVYRPIEGSYSNVNLIGYLEIINKDIKRTNYGKFSELVIMRGYAQYPKL
jgi:hypothetical protein